MQRISTETDGHFKNGVRGVQRGTKFNAEWCNAVQEEIATFIEAAGITLDASNNSQLYAALLAILAAGIVAGNIEVRNGRVNLVGEGGSRSELSRGGIEIDYQTGGTAGRISLDTDGLYLNGILVAPTVVSGVPVLNIDQTVELVKKLIVNGTASFKDDVAIAEGKKLVGNTEGYHVGNVRGRVTGDTNGTHYGNVRTANIYAIDNNGAIGINAPAVFSQLAHFQTGIVSNFLSVSVSGGYSSALMDSSVYTSMPDGAVVNCLNVSGGLSGVAVSSSEWLVMRAGTGVTVVKLNGRWYPMCPDVEFGSR